MRTRAPYTPVKLFYDGRVVEPGDYMQTPTKTTYLIEKVTPSKSNPQRRYLACLRWPPDKIPADATVHPLVWYPRKKKAGRSLRSLN